MIGAKPVARLAIKTLFALAAIVPGPVSAGPKPPPAEAGPAALKRTDITTFEAWRVTCHDDALPKKRACWAELKILQTNPANQQTHVVFVWTIGLKDGRPLSVWQVPTGVSVAQGATLRIGSGEVRKYGYSTCQPTFCDIAVPMDDALIDEASKADKADIAIVAADGRGLTFTVKMQGFDKVLKEIRT